ncbi:MAG: hypothetical protein NT166_08760 [Candidatus Aminicenantes bacterium]|nr:hypothetical protein [Candidatus Aminicenantes bacterium]
MKYLGHSITFFMENSLIVLTGIKDDIEAINLLTAFNYDGSTIKTGLNVHTIAAELESRQIGIHGELLNTGQEFQSLSKAARIEFTDYAKLIDLEYVSSEDNPLRALANDVIKDRGRLTWLKKAKEYYYYVLKSDSIISRISIYGLTRQRIETALNNITTVEDTKAKYLRLKGDAEESIRKRDHALKELETWMKKLISVCRIAFKEHPQFLEKIGIQVLSEGYKRAKAPKEPSGKKSTTKTRIEMPPEME